MPTIVWKLVEEGSGGDAEDESHRFSLRLGVNLLRPILSRLKGARRVGATEIVARCNTGGRALSNRRRRPCRLRLGGDVGDVGRLLLAHHAIALEDRPLLDDESRGVDVAIDLAVAVDLGLLGRDDLAADGAADGPP